VRSACRCDSAPSTEHSPLAHALRCAHSSLLSLFLSNFGAQFREAAEPTLPEKEEEDDQLEEDEEERRTRLAEEDGRWARLRTKQESFDQAVIEVQAEDLEYFLQRLSM
jgi:hypothetical protein